MLNVLPCIQWRSKYLTWELAGGVPRYIPPHATMDTPLPTLDIYLISRYAVISSRDVPLNATLSCCCFLVYPKNNFDIHIFVQFFIY